ncbi:hypothetical protein BGZ76_009209, partial [Entomortierella beljakovae]
MENVKNFLKDDNKHVFLLLGDSGAGKSTFTSFLEQKLWKEYSENFGDIPLFISLANVSNPYDDLIGKYLESKDFDKDAIKYLKNNRKLVLICDGYDEIQLSRNIYMSNTLNTSGTWQVKMMISCRTEHIGDNDNYKILFEPQSPSNMSKLADSFQEAVLLPFNNTQVENYINGYVQANEKTKETLQWGAEFYLEKLKKTPNLRKMATNPFLLDIMLNNLPQLINNSSSSTSTGISRVELYDKFVVGWIERNEKRYLRIKEEKESHHLSKLLRKGLARQGRKYLKDLSAAIYDCQEGNWKIEYKEKRDCLTWKKNFFGTEGKEEILNSSIPLIRIGAVYQFIHKSVLEYGLSIAIFDDPGTTINDMANNREDMLKNLYGSPLGRIDIVKEPSVVRFLADRVVQCMSFRDLLLEVINRSKKSWVDETNSDRTTLSKEILSCAATNAMTILVKAGTQFHGTDLRGITITGADLSNGVFDSVVFEGSDLQNVNFRNAWLKKANLDGCKLSGIKLGEIPSLKEDGAIFSGVFSPVDSAKNMFVTLMRGGIVRVHETLGWTEVYKLNCKPPNVTCIALSPSCEDIALGSKDGRIEVRNITNKRSIRMFKGHHDSVNSISYSIKLDRIASGSQDRTVRVWDTRTATCVRIFDGHEDGVTSVSYCRNENRVLSGSRDTIVRLWDVETGSLIRIFEGHSGIVTSVAYSFQGNHIASGSKDGTVKIWDESNAAILQDIQCHSGSVYSIAYSPFGNRVASSGSDKAVHFWDIETGTIAYTLSGNTGSINSIAYSPTGDKMASGDSSGKIQLWDIWGIDDEISTSGLQSHSIPATGLMYSSNGDRIATISDNRLIRIWDTETGRLSWMPAPVPGCKSIAFSSYGNQIAARVEGEIQIWDESGYCISNLLDQGGINIPVYSPNGDLIASLNKNNCINIWKSKDRNNSTLSKTLECHITSITKLAFSPDGNRIACMNDKSIEIWNIDKDVLVQMIIYSDKSLANLIFSPNGELIAAVVSDIKKSDATEPGTTLEPDAILVWDAESGVLHQTIKRRQCSIICGAFSPNGLQLACGRSDGVIQIWDINLRKFLSTGISCFGGAVRSIAWRGKYLAAGSEDCIVRQWELVIDEYDRDESDDGHANKGTQATICWMTPHSGLETSGCTFRGNNGLST